MIKATEEHGGDVNGKQKAATYKALKKQNECYLK